jgi:hypothetical protein
MQQYLDVTHLQILVCSTVCRIITFVLIIRFLQDNITRYKNLETANFDKQPMALRPEKYHQFPSSNFPVINFVRKDIISPLQLLSQRGNIACVISI